ncbi:MAG: YfhO family protein [Clostridia bacterium]|nr:YfhO family protein [Clostridia bacterium]
MNFSEGKATLLRRQKEKWLSTFLYALLAAALLFLPHIIADNGYFLFYGDYNVQQIPFYQMCHKAIKSGNIGWNWNTDLGANFIGSYSFYLLGSPFFWLTIPFPNWMVPYLVAPLLVLKFACSALTAYCYIRRFTRRADSARLGGLLYAFSGFSIYNIFFNHFHEVIVVFPLLLLAMELLITENKRGVFALAVLLCALVNYFFFFGMVVFSVIYFLVRVISRSVKITVSRFIALAFEAILGLAMSAILLLPSIAAIMSNSRLGEILLGWNAIMYGKEQIYLNVIECFFFPPDIPARPVFFPGADVKWSSLGGWMPLFSMVGVFTLFINKKGSWQKRLIGICAFMALVPFLNSAFYAFNTAYYARWFYMPILIMSLSTVMLTEEQGIDWSGGYKWVLGITLAFAAVIGLFPQKDSEGKITLGLYTKSDDYTYLARFCITAAIAIISLIVLYLMLKVLKKNPKTFYKGATACVLVLTVIYGTVYVISGRSHSYAIDDVMIEDMIEGQVDLGDSTQFRIDTFDCVDNTGMYLELPAINAFHSVVPGSIMEFYDFVGEGRSVASRPETDNYALRPLLSVKYLLNRSDGDSFIEDDGEPLMPGYKYVKTENDYYIYENENYIPYGFSYNYYMDYKFCEDYNEESRAALMLKAILLTDEQIEKYGEYLTNIEEMDYSYNLDSTTLHISEETMSYDCKQLAETAAESFKVTKKGFTAEVTRDNKNLVFFSVPYDEGWSATVNGRKVDIEKVNAGFMAVPVDSGRSVIEFTYTTPMLDKGILITLAATLIFLIYFIISFLVVKYKGKETEYPEGDILLRRWKEEEIVAVRDELSLRLEDIEEKPSILDDGPVEIPSVNEGFEGGFQIDLSEFEENSN